MKTNLSVNLNKVALLRNQRFSGCLDVLDVARVVIGAGADGLAVHPVPMGATFAIPTFAISVT
jgi:pyridoxine 5-phosphate synthase